MRRFTGAVGVRIKLTAPISHVEPRRAPKKSVLKELRVSPIAIAGDEDVNWKPDGVNGVAVLRNCGFAQIEFGSDAVMFAQPATWPATDKARPTGLKKRLKL